VKKVCVIEGNLTYRQRCLEKIKASLGDFEQYIFDKDDSYEYISQMISEISCFGSRRLFIIKEMPSIQVKTSKSGSEKKTLMRTKILNNFKKIIPNIPMGNVVVFYNLDISVKGFLNEVKKHGEVFYSKQKISKDEAKKIIFNYFKKKELEIDDSVSSFIAESLNTNSQDVDVDKLNLLLLQIYNYVYGKSQIVKKDLFNICSASKEFVIWALYDILDGQDGEDPNDRYSRAFVLVNNFLNSSRHFNYEVTMLMNNMLWRYGLILMCRRAVEQHSSKKEITQEILNIKKLTSSGRSQKIQMIMKEDKPEYSEKMINTILNPRFGRDLLLHYGFEDLLNIYKTISKSLIKIRTGCTDSEIMVLMQIVLLTICGELNKQSAISGILEPKKMLRKGM
jgi:hypothetical protein